VTGALFPVSVKGVVPTRRGVVLLKNERDEWELPGGRLEAGETPKECVEREVLEETGLAVHAERLLNAWVYEVPANRRVFVLAYGCQALEERAPSPSSEHAAVGVFGAEELADLRMPREYLDAIRAYWA
jgi:mutator protein MutT